MQHFFNNIIYSSSNEDSESERRALNIDRNDTVLCITGSGARTLDLLIDSPYKIVSIDFNKTQNYLLGLKIAAYKALNYEEFCSFLGLRPSHKRIEIYKNVQPFLSKDAIIFWSKNISKIENGVLYCGKWESFLKNMLRLSWFKKKAISDLMNASNIETQRIIWEREFNGLIWKLFLKIISNRFLWIYIFREPGAKIIPKEFDVYSYIRSRIDYMAMNFYLKTNHYANLLFLGHYAPNCTLPHHLRKENFEIIKQNLSKIEIISEDINQYLVSTKNLFSAFSLSDFSSYADIEMYHKIWDNVLKKASHHAKFCERQFLIKRNPEKKYQSLIRDTKMENLLNKSDETAIYTFCVGTIKKK